MTFAIQTFAPSSPSLTTLAPLLRTVPLSALAWLHVKVSWLYWQIGIRSLASISLFYIIIVLLLSMAPCVLLTNLLSFLRWRCFASGKEKELPFSIVLALNWRRIGSSAYACFTTPRLATVRTRAFLLGILPIYVYIDYSVQICWRFSIATTVRVCPHY